LVSVPVKAVLSAAGPPTRNRPVPSELALPSVRPPPLRASPPLKSLFPDSVSVPLPFLISPPAPVTVPPSVREFAP